MGRLPVIATLQELDEETLMQILTEPKNAVVKQFQKLFAMEEAELEIRPDALKAIARKAIKRKTGARGLRSILESALLDTMYELPTQSNIKRVVLEEAAITGEGKPLLVFADESEPKQEPKKPVVRDAAA